MTDQVGLLTDMVKTLLSSRDLVTPTSLSASTSPEVLTARQRDLGSSISSSFEVIDRPSDSPLGHTMPVVGSHLQMSTLDPDKTGSRTVLSQGDRGLPEHTKPLAAASSINASNAPGSRIGTQPRQLGPGML